MTTSTDHRIRQFIEEAFPLETDVSEIAGDASLLKEGIIDSIGVLTVVTFLEEEFAIIVEDDEVVPENLDSIDALVAFVQLKTSGR